MTDVITLANSRLKTPGGIPYLVKEGMSGSIGVLEADMSVVAIIRATDLFGFAQELMPYPNVVGNFVYWQVKTLPGFPSMGCRNITFKGHEGTLPIDPFSFDAAGANSYDKLLEITVEYAPTKKTKPNPQNPQSYLEISSTTSFEVLNVYGPKSEWVIEENPNVAVGSLNTEDQADQTWVNEDGVMFGIFTDPITGQKTRGPVDNPTDPADARKTNKEAGGNPVSIIVPIINWTVRWPEVDYQFFNDFLISRIRACGGKVNSRPVGFLYDAHPETLLFTGWNHTEKNSWRQLDGTAGFSDSTSNTTPAKPGEPPLTVTFHFSQKHILWDGVIRGWNHAWSNAEGGWVRLELFPDKIDGLSKHGYAKWDHNLLFKVT